MIIDWVIRCAVISMRSWWIGVFLSHKYIFTAKREMDRRPMSGYISMAATSSWGPHYPQLSKENRPNTESFLRSPARHRHKTSKPFFFISKYIHVRIWNLTPHSDTWHRLISADNLDWNLTRVSYYRIKLQADFFREFFVCFSYSIHTHTDLLYLLDFRIVDFSWFCSRLSSFCWMNGRRRR